MEWLKFDEKTGIMHRKKMADVQTIVDANKEQRIARPEFGKYKGNLVHVGRIDPVDVERLYNMGYNLLSHDRDEYRRALLYIQNNEPYLLTVQGKPFAKNRPVWG